MNEDKYLTLVGGVVGVDRLCVCLKKMTLFKVPCSFIQTEVTKSKNRSIIYNVKCTATLLIQNLKQKGTLGFYLDRGTYEVCLITALVNVHLFSW